MNYFILILLCLFAGVTADKLPENWREIQNRGLFSGVSDSAVWLQDRFKENAQWAQDQLVWSWATGIYSQDKAFEKRQNERALQAKRKAITETIRREARLQIEAWGKEEEQRQKKEVRAELKLRKKEDPNDEKVKERREAAENRMAERRAQYNLGVAAFENEIEQFVKELNKPDQNM